MTNQEWVPVDLYEEEQEFQHVNPNIIATTAIQKNYGNDTEKFPFLVSTYLHNHEIVEYKMKTKAEAKAFIRKLGAIV